VFGSGGQIVSKHPKGCLSPFGASPRCGSWVIALQSLNWGQFCIRPTIQTKNPPREGPRWVLLFGSGGWLPTLSKLLINASDITAKPPPLPLSISALLSSSPTDEGVHASVGANYTRSTASPTSGGQ
jgi:hypothetical protein